MQRRLLRSIGSLSLGLLAIFMLDAAAPRAQVPVQARDVSALAVKAQQQGRVRVIVTLRVGAQIEADLGSPDAVAAQRAAIQSARVQVLARANGLVENVKAFAVVAGFGATVDATTLAAFAADPLVERIEEDVPVPPTLAQSVPLINADDLWSAGHTGSGYAVAVLDTGVDKTHEFLDGGKVVSEACYATTVAGQSTSTCPNGTDLQEGSGAGVNCSASYAGCDHGTHVAGIAAGTGASGGFHGVARNASVIAVQVFSYFPASEPSCGGSQCVLAYTSDQILGLERVYALRNTYNIASINMSLGGGNHSANCDGDSRKTIIDNLRAAGIATVISSGNSSFTSSMGAPACISSAVSVGSTTKLDVVSSFSNSASFLHLLAPGSSINSSVPGNAYSSFNGTSMAAPHVAGGWALLKQAHPTKTVTEILDLLVSTGVPVTDTRSGAGNRVKPRIDLLAALNGGGPPGAATLVSPTGTIGTPNPAYTWNKVGSATWYELFVAPTSSPGSPIISQWYQSSICGASTCSVAHAQSVASGTPYTWWVRTWSPNGYGPWSSGMSFTPSISAPGAATLVSPTGTVGTPRPTMIWNKVDAAAQYELYISRGSTVVRDTWHVSSDVCSASTCSFALPSDLSTGGHNWWIRTWNSTGYGPWSSAGSFTVGPPGAATLTSPNGTISEATPVFKWVPASGSTWYHLWVSGPGGTVEQWFEGSGICSASECAVTSPSSLAEGSHTWWIRTWSTLGYGPWSSGMNFTRTASPAPAAPTPVSPTGGSTVFTMTPTYTFSKVTGATWYHLWVNGPSGNVIAQWYESSAICGAGSNCSVTPTTVLQAGTHNWWVQAWNTNGYSPWSSMATFTTSSTFVTAVLTWGANPADLDAHLLTPPIGGSTHHVYFGNRGSRTSAPFAQLDVDDQNGFGPETLSIHQDFSSAGTYKIYVHRWTGSGTLAGSGAQVKVYNNGTLISTQTVPASGSGDYWLVCQIANLTLTCPNTIMASAPTVEGQTSEPVALKTKPQPSEGPSGPERHKGPPGSGGKQ